MASTLELTCSECGLRHTLCQRKSDFFVADAEYEYVCPKTGNQIRFVKNHDWNEADMPGCPKGSVLANICR
jgi:hypothetical protein